jgi:hypothetical protein
METSSHFFIDLLRKIYIYNRNAWVLYSFCRLSWRKNADCGAAKLRVVRLHTPAYDCGPLKKSEALSSTRVKTVIALPHATPKCIQNITVPIQFQGGALELASSSKSFQTLLESYANASAPKELVFIACRNPPWV